MMMMPPHDEQQISVSGVAVDYGAGAARNRVLHGINLSVPKGGFVSLIGPSGCGKSTLLKLLAGLLAALGSGLFTSDKLIATNPDLVRRFVKAYLESMAYVAAHPDQAVAMIVKANPEYAGKEAVLREELGFDIAHSFFSPATAAHGIGWISPAQWASTVAMLQKQAGLPASACATGGFDDAFVDAAKPEDR